MKVALFIPCYVDQFYPEVGIATLELLEKYGVEVDYPLAQTCCGQPMANSGYQRFGDDASRVFMKNFGEYEYVVAPSGSCTLHVKEHVIGENEVKVYELCEFLTDILKVEEVGVSFPFKVGLHASCHGLRGLRLAKASEIVGEDFNKPRKLLEKVKDIQLVELQRKDECCGFGGTFAVSEEAISVRMGMDRLADHVESGVEVITSADISCLMHLQGLSQRNRQPVRIMHIAQILNGSIPS
jgi:L-lactate dehydrogenase complex protein LldE